MSVEEQRYIVSIDSVACEVNALASDIAALVGRTRSSEEFRACLNNPNQLKTLIVGIGTFVAIDLGFHSTAHIVGRMIENILAQDHDEQHDFLRALCAAQNLTPLNDKKDSTRTGRASLIHALFGAHPELLRRSGKDSIAEKWFNYCLSQAKKATCTEHRVRMVISAIDANVAMPPRELATIVCLSLSRLRHLFKREMEVALSEYLLEIRLQQACILLSTTYLSVKEIRNRINIPDAANFSHSFAQRFRVSPSDYRLASPATLKKNAYEWARVWRSLVFTPGECVSNKKMIAP